MGWTTTARFGGRMGDELRFYTTNTEYVCYYNSTVMLTLGRLYLLHHERPLVPGSVNQLCNITL